MGHTPEHPSEKENGNEHIIAPEQIRKISPLLAALAWENYLKRLANETSRDEAIVMLIDDLLEYRSEEKADVRVPFLDGNPNLSAEELVHYVEGRLVPSESRFARTIFPSLQEIKSGFTEAEKWSATREFHEIELRVRKKLFGASSYIHKEAWELERLNNLRGEFLAITDEMGKDPTARQYKDGTARMKALEEKIDRKSNSGK